MSHNQISTLPAGVFEGLGNLDSVEFDYNTGAPFTITAELEKKGAGVVVSIDEGAPSSLSVTLSATGGTLSTQTVTVARGALESETITVTASGTVTVSVDSVAKSGTRLIGLEIVAGSDLTLVGGL